MVDPKADGLTTVTFEYVAPLTRPVASAVFAIEFHDLPIGSTDPRSVTVSGVFNEARTVDASVRPPDIPANACGKSASQLAAEKKARLRKRAEKDPDGADGAAIDGMSRNEVLATAINSAGFLCAKVQDTYPVSGGMIVTCTEYRSGKGRAKYKIDTSAMEVTKLD